MPTKKTSQMEVAGGDITATSIDGDDYICLTDMAKNYGNGGVIEKWLRNKNTVEFLGIWESLNNPDFNYPEFEGIKNQAGLNRFTMSVKQWIESTGAKGIVARSGRYGGTYAHKDIAFEFAAWISPEFKLLLIKEFQRMKLQEQEGLEWDYRRFLSKVNYRLHTDSIKEKILPILNVPKNDEWLVYAEEADILNVALFGKTAKEWRDENQSLSGKQQNIRDHASIAQLTVLSNLESLNSMMIHEGVDKKARFIKLRGEAERQLKTLESNTERAIEAASNTMSDFGKNMAALSKVEYISNAELNKDS